MRKRTKKLTLRSETLVRLSERGAQRIAGAAPTPTCKTCTTDWFSCLGYTCQTFEFDTCTEQTR